MDYKQLQRNPKMVMSELVTRPDGSVVTKNGCKIYFPVRYADIELAEVGADNLCVGIFPIVVQDKYYSVLIVDAMVSLKPSDINKVKIDEIPYYEFIFEPGSVVIATLDLVQDGKMLYRIYNEFFTKDTVPTESCDIHVMIRMCRDTNCEATPYCTNVYEKLYYNMPMPEVITLDSEYIYRAGIAPALCTRHTHATQPTPPVIYDENGNPVIYDENGNIIPRDVPAPEVPSSSSSPN